MGVPKYVINLDEFAKLWQDLTLQPDFSNEKLDAIAALLKDKLAEIADLLRQLLPSMGQWQFHSVDMSKHIPAIVNLFEVVRTFETDVYLTGITFAQTAWNVEDTISLEISGVLVIDRLHTKEIGQQKLFTTFVPVKAGEKVRLLYDNKEGHSKMFFCDLDYIV